MPIHRLLNGSSLAPNEIARLQLAYDLTLRALHLVDRNDPITEMVAKRVIEIGKHVDDAVEISRRAVKDFDFGRQESN